MKLPWQKVGTNGEEETIGSDFTDDLMNRWDELSSRDKFALIALTVFLFCFVGLYGGWALYSSAQESQKKFDAKVSDLFWLRSQANNLKAQGNQSDSPEFTNQITQMIQNSGIPNPNVIQAKNSVQFSFEHPSQAMVSRVLSQMQANGYKIVRLSANQENEQIIKVEGTINAS